MSNEKQSLGPCVYSLYLFVCVISNQSTSKKPHYVSDLIKFDALLYHNHKKWKDSLEMLAKQAGFSLLFEFRKLLESSLRELASNINKKVQGTIKQFKAKGLILCFALNLIMSGENCLNFNWHSSRAAEGIWFCRVPTKDDEYSITKETTLLQLLLMIRWLSNLKSQIKNKTFWVALSSRKHDLS